MKCECTDWKENIGKVDAPLLLAFARSGGSVQYEGKRWTFCPWCSLQLKEEDESTK